MNGNASQVGLQDRTAASMSLWVIFDLSRRLSGLNPSGDTCDMVTPSGGLGRVAWA